MNPKITARYDPNSLEESYFTLRLSNPLTAEEIKKLTDLGGSLKYDNGNMALITILPGKVAEVALLESVIEVR